MQACKLLRIDIIVGETVHGGEKRKEQGCRRCLLVLNWRVGDGVAVACS